MSRVIACLYFSAISFSSGFFNGVCFLVADKKNYKLKVRSAERSFLFFYEFFVKSYKLQLKKALKSSSLNIS